MIDSNQLGRPAGLVDEFQRALASQGAVWMVNVVILAPLIGQYSHHADVIEQLSIQHVFMEGPVKALNKPALRWFTGLYVLDGYIMFDTE